MFKGGQSNPTYKLHHAQRSYVMRAKPGPVAKLLPSAHAIEREFAVMRGLQGTDVPVPRMYACARTNPSSAAPSTSWSSCRAACCGTSPCPA
jgi:aminoglycoside phosphotransferase (APT) family kinase protein